MLANVHVVRERNNMTQKHLVKISINTDSKHSGCGKSQQERIPNENCRLMVGGWSKIHQSHDKPRYNNNKKRTVEARC